MARKKSGTNLPAPFLQRLVVRPNGLESKEGYPFDLPWLNDDFEMRFTTPVTIIVGENGSGKSTLIEAIAAISGFDEAGGSKDHRAVDHSRAADKSGALLGDSLRAGWLPKVTNGWFFRAETFFSVARYLDQVGSPSAGFLSGSHGEGFIRVFEERMSRQGIYLMDEPESALSPKRQLELLKFLVKVQQDETAQVIMATHSPLLMAVPDATLLKVTRRGFGPVHYRDTEHFQLYQSFIADPEDFIKCALNDEEFM